MIFTYFKNLVAGNIFRTKTTPGIPSSYFIGLSVAQAAPNADGTGITEPSASNGYARIKLESLSEPANGVITNNSSFSFDESTGDWGTAYHFVLFDAATGGHPLLSSPLNSTKTIEEGSILTVRAHDARFSIVEVPVV